MAALLTDTPPEITALQARLLRQVGPARKLEMVCQLNQAVLGLALAGLQARYPREVPARLRRRLADLVLGAELARRVYGPLDEGG